MGAVCILAALSTVGCSDRTVSAGTERHGGTSDERPLEMLLATEPELLDPRYTVSAMALRVTRLLHAGLSRLDPDTLEPIPYIAQSWEWTSPLTLKVTLREGARFHSGRPLLADDVVATVQWMQSPEHHGRNTQAVDEVARVEAISPETVVFTMRQRRASALADLDFPILRRDELSLPPDHDGRLDGLGPFTAKPNGGGLLLTPVATSPLGAHGRPIELRVVHSETARIMRLESGEADLAVNALSLPLLPDSNDRANLRVVHHAAANVTYLLLNHRAPPFDDATKRRSLAQAIDTPRLARALFGGYATAADTLLSPLHWAYSPPDVSPTPQPASAQAHIESSAPLTLLTSTDRTRVNSCRLIAAELEARGIPVEVVSLEWTTFLARLTAGRFDVAMLQIPELAEPSILRNFLHSAAVPPAGANRGGIDDAELDALLDRADLETDRGERKQDVHQVEERVRKEAHLVPLWHEDHVAVMSSRVGNFLPSADGRWMSLAELDP